MPLRPRISFAVALCAFALIAITRPSFVRAADANLILNADISKGSGEQPDNWRTEAWVQGPDAFQYHWIHPSKGEPGQLEVDALKPDDARWMQSLTLSPGWYRFSADVRTENVGLQQTGATISIMDGGAMSPDIRGTASWQTAAFYLKVGGSGADVEVALRVGGFGSLNTGRAFFRNVSVEKLAAPPPGATPAYDLTEIRKADQPAPIGHPITLLATFFVLAMVAVYGWRLYGTDEPVPAISKAAPPKTKEKTKARARR